MRAGEERPMKKTAQLMNKIKSSSRMRPEFLEDPDFTCPRFHYYLADLLRERQMSPQEYFRLQNLERSYGYQILNGRRKPSRELLIRTAILLKMELEEAQRLLKIGNREILYPRVKRDALAIYAIEKKLSFLQYQELLEEYEEGI